MSKEGGPSGHEGSGDCLAQGVRALAGSGFGNWRMNPAASSLQRPPASTPKTTRRQRPGWTSSGHIRSLDLRASRSAVPAYSPLCCRSAAWLVRGETMVVSMANWLPPQRGKPFALTSLRRFSIRWTVGILRSEIRVCVVTLALAPRGCLDLEVPLISGMLHCGRQGGLKRDSTDRHVQ